MAERGFSPEELQARILRAQTAMAAQDMAGILLCSEAELRYFTGFFTPFWQSPTRPWFLFLPANGAPVAVIPDIGAGLMATTPVTDIRTWNAPTPADDGITLLQDLLAPLAANKEKLGLLKGPETALRMPIGDFERLCAGLPGLAFVDATPLVADLRMVKSESEIAKISKSCAIIGQTFGNLPDFLRSGMSLADLFRAFRREALACGADEVPYLVGDAGPGGYASVIAPPSNRPLARGDVLMLDTGATWDGYFCDFDRNFALGQADALSQSAYQCLWEATEAGLAAARPGATCRDVFTAMQTVTRAMDPGGDQIGRLGHGLGMQLTEWPSFAAFDRTELRENMVLTLEPSLSYGDGRIMVHEENIVIRPAGAVLLTTRAAPSLPVLDGGWP